MRNTLLSALLGLAMALGATAMTVGTADAAYKSATYRGKAFCPKGTHYSPRKGGQCWSCNGRQRNGLARIAGPKACKTKAYKRYRGATLVKPTGKVIKLKCPKGYKLDAPAGQCWSCPRGYVRTLSKVTGKRACTNKFGEIFAANKGAMCRKVVTAIRKGSDGVGKFQNTVRKLTAPVMSPVRKAMNKVMPDIKSPKAVQKIARQVSKTTERYQPVMGELARVANLMNRRPNPLANVMLNAGVMCSGDPRRIQRALVKAGLNPNFKVGRKKARFEDGLLIRSAHASRGRRAYHAVSIASEFVTTKLFGPTLSLTVVTDLRRNLRLYFSFGAVVASASGYDRSVSYMIFPHVSIDDFDKFDQLGLELGFSSIKKYEDFVAKKKFPCTGPANTTPVPGPGGTVAVPAPKQLHCRWPKDVGIAVSFDPPVFRNFIANVPGIGINWSGEITKPVRQKNKVKLFGGTDISLSGDYTWKLLPR